MPSYTEKAVGAVKVVADKVDPYVPQFAKNTATAADSCAKTVNYGVQTVNSTVTNTVDYAKNTITGGCASVYNFGRVVVNGATTTITAYTPTPLIKLVTSTVEGATTLGRDPVGTVKPYVPTFVIHAGEKTYEIVHHAGEVTSNTAKATTGFIVTKVNGTVKYVTDIPQIAGLIDKINGLTQPVLKRFGVKQADGSISAENAMEG